jgi:hypothetical protein
MKYDGVEPLSKNEPYYQIEGYTVVREGGEMKIAGINSSLECFNLQR